MLGKVISTLSDKMMGKNMKSIIPYRDSKLTKLLANALGGNSKTSMICTISPGFRSYSETVSTLRYAEKARNIKNNAIKNELNESNLLKLN